MSDSTIAAIATAPGRGGVAVVRVSGPDAFRVAERLTGRRFGENDRFPLLRFSRFGEVERQEAGDERGRETGGAKTIDTGILLAFKAPRSYTGEDVVEFQCHGGTVVPHQVLEACFAAGAVPARRGEFTERAFLNGKLDLSQAEAVIELVDAKTDRAAADAAARLGGAKAPAYRTLYEQALAISAELEHALDVDEEELPADFLPARVKRAAALADAARRAAGSADAGRLLRDGALVVLAGAPNAGKSSLLNALCGEDRAIVSPTPGTTRDTIEAWIDLDGWPVRLVDTAGLRETGDAIEAEGVRRAEALLAQADVVVALDCALDGALRVHAKCDLDGERTTSVRQQEIGAKTDDTSCCRTLAVSAKTKADGSSCCRTLAVSAKTGAGLDALRAAIVARLAERAGATSEDGATASERERAILLEAARLLERAEEDIVLFANRVRTAAETLGSLIGATYSSDLLDHLFSRFCVGK